jgi:hypothetical protein
MLGEPRWCRARFVLSGSDRQGVCAGLGYAVRLVSDDVIDICWRHCCRVATRLAHAIASASTAWFHCSAGERVDGLFCFAAVFDSRSCTPVVEGPNAHPRWVLELDGLAVDRDGHAARFSSSGCGPVSASALELVAHGRSPFSSSSPYSQRCRGLPPWGGGAGSRRGARRGGTVASTACATANRAALTSMDSVTLDSAAVSSRSASR